MNFQKIKEEATQEALQELKEDYKNNPEVFKKLEAYEKENGKETKLLGRKKSKS